MSMTATILLSSKDTAGSICNWINRSTTDAATVLTEAQAMIYSRLRHWRMKTEATGTMTADQPYINLPSDFLDARLLRITGVYAQYIRRGEERFVQDRYEYDNSGNRLSVGPPEYFYIGGNGGTPRAYFDNQPDLAYPYLMPYWAVPTALAVTTNETNWLTTFYPRLLRVSCMLIATEFEKEVGQGQYDRSWWDQQFEKQLALVQGESNMVERASDSPVVFA